MRSTSVVIIAVLWILMATSTLTAAESLSIHFEVRGGLDAWLDGLSFSATIDGDVDFVGDVPRDDGSIWVSAVGNMTGTGFYSLLEIMTRGWILMTAIGRTDGEEVVILRSLFYASRQSLVPLQAGVLFEGVHHTVIQIGDSTDVYWGVFTGTLAGGLAPAEAEGTIRLVGSGSFCLSGERVSEPDSDYLLGTIPLDDPNLSEEFVRSVYAFFDLPIAREPLSVGNDP